eukprot:3874812-Rhodomonas_salina.1
MTLGSRQTRALHQQLNVSLYKSPFSLSSVMQGMSVPGVGGFPLPASTRRKDSPPRSSPQRGLRAVRARPRVHEQTKVYLRVYASHGRAQGHQGHQRPRLLARAGSRGSGSLTGRP